jgi:hypothetical protein
MPRRELAFQLTYPQTTSKQREVRREPNILLSRQTLAGFDFTWFLEKRRIRNWPTRTGYLIARRVSFSSSFFVYLVKLLSLPVLTEPQNDTARRRTLSSSSLTSAFCWISSLGRGTGEGRISTKVSSLRLKRRVDVRRVWHRSSREKAIPRGLTEGKSLPYISLVNGNLWCSSIASFFCRASGPSSQINEVRKKGTISYIPGSHSVINRFWRGLKAELFENRYTL